MKFFIIGVIIAFILFILLLVFSMCKISGKASDAEIRREEEEKLQ